VSAQRVAYLARVLTCMLLGSACSSHGALLPIPAGSQRLVQTPSGIAVLTQAEAQTGLPGDITFGGPNGRSALYLQFSPEWRAHGAPLRGFLVLEPLTGAAPEPEPVAIEAWRVRAPWHADRLHAWSDKPELAPPYARTLTAGAPARSLRLDITELLRFAANHPEMDQGIALIAGRGSGHGASFATGMNGDAVPRLEVYTR